MKTLTYFVPIDFSQSSYNALHYAILLAKLSEGSVRLFHVVDPEEIPESDNQVVVSFALDRLERKAKDKLRSLREMISIEGLEGEDSVVTGRVKFELLKHIKGAKPSVIVMGKEVDGQPDTHSVVSFITRNTEVPVLVVPSSHNPKIPNRAVLATDTRPDKISGFAECINIIKMISQEISVLNVGRNVSPQGRDAIHWLEEINSTYGISASFITNNNSKDGNEIANFIRNNKVDLLCTIKRNQNFLDRLFRRRISNPFVVYGEVPVLFLNG
jgi:nucleotide-binding universal stress UspA family protein